MTNVTKYWKKAAMPLLLFYVIAVACRLISLYVLPRLFPDSCSSIILQLCEGVGPALGGVVVMGIFKRKFFCSIAGKSWIRSLACIVFPTLLFLIFDTHHGLRTSLVFLGCTLYAFLEEVGWRGYLTGELAAMRPIKRILTITVLWFFLAFELLFQHEWTDILRHLTVGFLGIGPVCTRHTVSSAMRLCPWHLQSLQTWQWNLRQLPDDFLACNIHSVVVRHLVLSL